MSDPQKERIREQRLASLVDAGHAAIKRFQPADGVTYCNFGTDFIARAMGFTGFAKMLANNIVDRMKNAPDFAVVDADSAQSLANDGRLVVAGLKDSPHGHCAVVAPGSTLYSGKWREPCPMVFNVGVQNRLCGANYAFGSKPTYYAWIEGPAKPDEKVV